MITEYTLVKFFHILIAILALGTSAGLGIVQEFYGRHPTHGIFVLRAIERLVAFFVLPGYALMLVTGLWMTRLGWPWATKWIQAAVVLWILAAVVFGIFLLVLHKQIALARTEGVVSKSYRRLSFVTRALGAGAGLIVVAILYLMVFKPMA